MGQDEPDTFTATDGEATTMQAIEQPGPCATEPVRILDGPAAGMRTTSRRDYIWVPHRRSCTGRPVPMLADSGLVRTARLNQAAHDTRREYPDVTWECYQRADIAPPVPRGWGVELPAYAISYRWVQRAETPRSLRIAAVRLP